MTRASLEALAARFEAAPANDAALFFEALDALALPRPLHYRIVRFIYGEAFLEAAASLVPDGYGWHVATESRRPLAWASCTDNNGKCPMAVKAARPALALTSAALRARAMEAPNAE